MHCVESDFHLEISKNITQMGNVACLQQNRSEHFKENWSKWVYTLPGEYKGISKRIRTNELTVWKSMHLFIDNVDSTTKSAQLFGVGISLFREREVPFIIMGMVTNDKVVIEKLHYNSNNIQNKVVYKLTLSEDNHLSYKATSRQSIGLITKVG